MALARTSPHLTARPFSLSPSPIAPLVTIIGGFVFLTFALTGLLLEEGGEDFSDKVQRVLSGGDDGTAPPLSN